MTHSLGFDSDALPSPAALANRAAMLVGNRNRLQAELLEAERELQGLREYLEVAPLVEQALELLSQNLFQRVVADLEAEISRALEDVLGQALRFRVDTEWLRGKAAIKFRIERDGNSEDIMRGQGGSVANVLSVCLRLYALLTLDEQHNRRVLILDEPDAWLRPDVVPNLVKIIKEVTQRLDFQVIMISHHDAALFEAYADRIYRFHPMRDGSVKVRLDGEPPAVEDGANVAPRSSRPETLFDDEV